MFSRTARDGSSDDERFSERLSALKRQGASVLVVGSVRTHHRRSICRRLLGQASAQSRRRVLVSTTGDGIAISDSDSELAPVKRVNYAAQTRTAAAGTTPDDHSGPSDVAPTQPTIDGPVTTLGDLGIAISDAIGSFETEAAGLEPAELRVGVDSLVPLLEEYGTEPVFKFVHLTSARVSEVDGMVHYHLPTDRDAEVVSVLTPLFDILVELRERDGTLQERWSITDSDHDSGWLSIDQP